MILGLYGESRSGKDTIARLVQQKYDFEWRSFATPLREILLKINPILDVERTIDEQRFEFRLQDAVENYGWDWVKLNYPDSVDLMINLGQGVRDSIHPDAWLWSVLDRSLPKRLVISDVRQENEYHAIRDAGGEIWKVVRPGTVKRGMDGLLDHLRFLVTIYNDGSIADLERNVCRELDYALQNRWN